MHNTDMNDAGSTQEMIHRCEKDWHWHIILVTCISVDILEHTKTKQYEPSQPNPTDFQYIESSTGSNADGGNHNNKSFSSSHNSNWITTNGTQNIGDTNSTSDSEMMLEVVKVD